MKQVQLKWVVLAMLIIPILFTGCAHVGTDEGLGIIATSEAFKNFSGEYENTAYFKKHKPASIAVLPFQFVERKSYSIDFDSEDPGGIVRRGMYNHVASLPFKDLELYKTDKFLMNAGIKDIRVVDKMIAENPKKLKSILGVDAAISGRVTHFDRIFLGIYSQVAVGCEVKMWDLNNGKLLWRAKQVARAHAGGLSINPIGLVMATAASLWNMRATEMLSQTDELFREIVSTIELPESYRFAQEPAPKIDLFAVVNSGKAFTAGQKAAFRLIGSPGCSAYVDLEDFKSNIELTPVSSGVKKALRSDVVETVKKNYAQTGHDLTPDLIAAIEEGLDSREIYEGNYTVEPGEQAYGLMAKAYLVDPSGNQGTAIDAVHIIDIDSLPPQGASGLNAESLSRKIKLAWSPNTEEDLARYEIWSSSSPLSGYALTATSEKSEAVIEELSNFTKIYFRVRAVDKANNAGGFSKNIEAVPLPEPDLYHLSQPGPVLGGEIKEKMLLVADKNPYTVRSDLRIVPGGVLYLEPGVEILFSPEASLTIAGGEFFVFGTHERPVLFSAKTNRKEPGSWRGVVMEDVKKSTIQHVTIEGAVTGLTVYNSSPSISSLTVSHCSQAGLYLKDKARPNISCSAFISNEGLGALIIEGEGLAPVIRDNVFQNNSPFQVQSYTALQMDLTGNFWGSSQPEESLFLGDVEWKPMLTAPPSGCTFNW